MDLSITEYAVLGLLAEGPNHGFAIAKDLAPSGEMGRIYTVRRPLVYRALDRLVAGGLVEPVHTEKGDAGPNRLIHRVTRRGRRQLGIWLAKPVSHIRDIRIELLLKIGLLDRAGESPLQLIESQREGLGSTLDALDSPAPFDHVELWRRHNAAAAARYLDELATVYRVIPASASNVGFRAGYRSSYRVCSSE